MAEDAVVTPDTTTEAPAAPVTNPGDAAKAGTTDTPAAAAPGVTDPLTAPDAPAGEGDNTAGKEAVATVPETYADFTLPEGMSLSAERVTTLTPLFKELGLTQEAAQKLIDFQASEVQASEEARSTAFNQLTQDWLTSTKADKEIGGENFEPSVQAARLALSQFGTPELNGLLKDYGIGNHPEVIRVFTRIGKLLKEDQPGSLSAPPTQKKDRASILYPSN